MSEKSCITINCGCCGGGTGSGGDGTPVGTVISYMGTKAPEHYLICDGAVLNIMDYPQLTEQVKAEFGAVDYFGGDGAATFAVPDLRNEFLRGFHGEAVEQLSGEVGKHQEATGHLPAKNNASNLDTGAPGAGYTNPDSVNGAESIIKYCKMSNFTATNNNVPLNFTSRPTNVAVLYCIKYE